MTSLCKLTFLTDTYEPFLDVTSKKSTWSKGQELYGYYFSLRFGEYMIVGMGDNRHCDVRYVKQSLLGNVMGP